MGLSIKNKDVENLVRTVARESGEGITETIRHALEERLQKIRRAKGKSSPFDQIMEISRRCGSLPVLDKRSPEEILGYNETGGLGW